MRNEDFMRDVGDLIAAYMDFLVELGDELDRNLNYEFNEYLKAKIQSSGGKANE